MTLCAAVGCKNTGTHIFPKDVNRRRLWEKALQRKNWKATDSSRLCAMHFKPDDYYGRNTYTGEAFFSLHRDLFYVYNICIYMYCTYIINMCHLFYTDYSNYSMFVTNTHQLLDILSVLGDESIHKVLKKSAVPSIFSHTKTRPVNQSSIDRSNRLMKRSKKKLCFEASTSDVSEPRDIQPLDGFEMQINDDQFLVDSEIEIPSYTSSEPYKNKHTKFESKSMQVNFLHIYGSIQKYKNNDSVISFYTGFETYQKFHFVYSTLSPMVHLINYYGSHVQNISTEDQFFMTMMKLRQNKCNFELAQFFQISQTTVYNIFITWINFIDQLWKKLNIWPDKDLVHYYMPDSFKQYDKNTRVIIDGTEMKIQKPGNPVSQQASWSSYKHSNTLKVLVGATPGGLLSYCSPAYAGSISDRQTVERSNLLKKCEPGDSILADRGYNIQDMFIEKDVSVNIPSFLKGKAQIPGLKLLKDRKLASQRVHIERLIGLTKTYKILREELHHNFVPLASKIFFVCLMCCNFRECIM